MASLSRQIASWVASLEFEDLPAEVVDRAKGMTLHGLASAMLGYERPAGRQALAVMQDEDAGGSGIATVIADGTKLTKGGAAFVNSELIAAGGKWDSFRMISHPGRNLLPAALATGEVEGASGRQYITAIAAGYEVVARLAADFLPTVMSRGFHASPVFGIFGAGVAAAKLSGLNADQIHNTIAQCVNLAAGNVESNRSGGQNAREGSTTRNALLGVTLAKHGSRGGETVLEGDGGFYHSYAGNNQGKLSYVFSGPKSTDLDRITSGLGKEWRFLEAAYRIYSTGGYNIAHVDVTAALCAARNIDFEDVDRVECVVNWLETLYPSPAFPAPEGGGAAKVGSKQYFTAYGVVRRGFPILGIAGQIDDPLEVLDLMQRVTIIPSKTQTLLGPTVRIYTKDGKRYTRKGSGREFCWDFEEEVRRIRDVAPGLRISEARFDELIETCRHLYDLANVADLIGLTIPGG